MVSNQIPGQEINHRVLGISGFMGLNSFFDNNWRRDEQLLEKLFKTVLQSAHNSLMTCSL